MDKPKDKPNFALLIGKKLDERDGTEPPNHLPDEEPGEELDDGDEAGMMQDSAVADLLSAIKTNNVPQAKAALKDFLELAKEDV